MAGNFLFFREKSKCEKKNANHNSNFKGSLIPDVIFLIWIGKLKQTTCGCVSLPESGKLNPELGNLKVSSSLGVIH